MMDFRTIVIIAFRIINSSILLMLGFYFVKKNLIPSLKEELKAAYNFFAQLYSKVTQLEVTTKEMNSKLQAEQEHYASLQQKINQWNLYLDELQNKRNQTEQLLAERLKNQNKVQEQQISQSYILRKIAPEVISMAQKELNEIVAQDQVAQNFLKRIVFVLGRNL